jgi:hypothetical protein
MKQAILLLILELILVLSFITAELSIEITEEQENLSSNENNIREFSETLYLNQEPVSVTNSIIYKSKNEYIKEYIGYAFAVFCVLMIIAIIRYNKNGIPDKKER